MGHVDGIRQQKHPSCRRDAPGWPGGEGEQQRIGGDGVTKNAHDYVCGVVRDGKTLDLRVDQLTLPELQQALCETFDLIDAMETYALDALDAINGWRKARTGSRV
jgi:hypothetical protein